MNNNNLAKKQLVAKLGQMHAGINNINKNFKKILNGNYYTNELKNKHSNFAGLLNAYYMIYNPKNRHKVKVDKMIQNRNRRGLSFKKVPINRRYPGRIPPPAIKKSTKI